MWRKLHITVDMHSYEIIAAELSLSNLTDAEVILNLLKQTYRKISNISGDSAYDSRECHEVIRRKRTFTLILPRDGGVRLFTQLNRELSETLWFK